MSLADAHVAARIPAVDLDRARTWYAEKLGLEPVEERPGGLRYLAAFFRDCEGNLFGVGQILGG